MSGTQLRYIFDNHENLYVIPSREHFGFRPARESLNKVFWGGWLPASTTAGEETLKGILERLSKISVEVGVDERVERRVEVPNPEQHRYDNIW